MGHIKVTGNHRSTCRKCESARVLKYKKEDPEKDNELGRQRAKRLKGWLPTPELKASLYKEQGGLCALCGSKINLPLEGQVEHLMPTIQDGNNDFINLVLAHSKCNQEKHEQNFAEYVEWRAKVGLPRSSFCNQKILKAMLLG